VEAGCVTVGAAHVTVGAAHVTVGAAHVTVEAGCVTVGAGCPSTGRSADIGAHGDHSTQVPEHMGIQAKHAGIRASCGELIARGLPCGGVWAAGSSPQHETPPLRQGPETGTHGAAGAGDVERRAVWCGSLNPQAGPESSASWHWW